MPISLLFNRQGHIDYIRKPNVLSVTNNACDSNANLHTGRVALLCQETIGLVCLLIVSVWYGICCWSQSKCMEPRSKACLWYAFNIFYKRILNILLEPVCNGLLLIQQVLCRFCLICQWDMLFPFSCLLCCSLWTSFVSTLYLVSILYSSKYYVFDMHDFCQAHRSSTDYFWPSSLSSSQCLQIFLSEAFWYLMYLMVRPLKQYWCIYGVPDVASRARLVMTKWSKLLMHRVDHLRPGASSVRVPAAKGVKGIVLWN